MTLIQRHYGRDPALETFLLINPKEDIEVCWFDEDPDGEQDRCPDGYFWRVDGTKSWDGSYSSEEQALDELADSLRYAEFRRYENELSRFGFKWSVSENTPKDSRLYKRQANGFDFAINVQDDQIVAMTAKSREDGSAFNAKSADTICEIPISDEDLFGLTHFAVRKAMAALLEKIDSASRDFEYVQKAVNTLEPKVLEYIENAKEDAEPSGPAF